MSELFGFELATVVAGCTAGLLVVQCRGAAAPVTFAADHLRSVQGKAVGQVAAAK